MSKNTILLIVNNKTTKKQLDAIIKVINPKNFELNSLFISNGVVDAEHFEMLNKASNYCAHKIIKKLESEIIISEGLKIISEFSKEIQPNIIVTIGTGDIQASGSLYGITSQIQTLNFQFNDTIDIQHNAFWNLPHYYYFDNSRIYKKLIKKGVDELFLDVESIESFVNDSILVKSLADKIR